MVDIVAAKEKILQLMRIKGPILPVDVSKLVGSILFAGAVLSELVQAKQIKISNAKIGSSPLYYLAEHASQLDRLYKYLHPQEQKAYDLIKEKNILKDIELNAVMRVALREIKDFALPIDVTYKDKKELFFRWYLLTEIEVNDLVSKKLEEQEKAAVVKTGLEVKKAEAAAPNIVQEVMKKEEFEAGSKKSEEKKEKKQKQAKERQGTLKKSEFEAGSKRLETKKEEVSVLGSLQPAVKKGEQEAEKPKEPLAVKAEDSFLDMLVSYFKNNNITMESYEIIKKESDIELIVLVSSAIGQLRYFCKARNKKRCTESDISSAIIKAQPRGLPMLFLTTGELAKGAEKMLTNEFKNIVFRKVA